MLDRMVRLTGRGGASGILEHLKQIEAYLNLVGIRTESRIPYEIPPMHTLYFTTASIR